MRFIMQILTEKTWEELYSTVLSFIPVNKKCAMRLDYKNKGCLQLGQVLSLFFTTYPHFLQVSGWAKPNGAPQAVQEAAPTGLAVSQYWQVVRLSLSERSVETPTDLTYSRITFQIRSLS